MNYIRTEQEVEQGRGRSKKVTMVRAYPRFSINMWNFHSRIEE